MANEIKEKLVAVQAKLKAPKNQYNNFGKYSYRNCEDILEAVKPLLNEQGLVLILTDDIEVKENGRTYVKAKACLFDGQNEIYTYAYAREPESKKGMDDSQITGATSSYARKYALNGLFLIDDQKDADNMVNRAQAPRNTASKPKAQAPQVDELAQVKAQAWAVIQRWCELNDANAQTTAEGIKKRPEFKDNKEFWTTICNEFNDDIKERLEATNVN